jgi:AraC-like DNA-binding protein
MPWMPKGTRLPNPRVQKIIDRAAAHLDEPLSLETACQSIYLSRSRLRHLSVEQTGLASKAYVLWRWLVPAVETYSNGTTLKEAAHAPGFFRFRAFQPGRPPHIRPARSDADSKFSRFVQAGRRVGYYRRSLHDKQGEVR